MRSQPLHYFDPAQHSRRAICDMLRGIVVPPQEVQIYLANGWNVLDDTTCGSVRVVPPDHIGRPRDGQA